MDPLINFAEHLLRYLKTWGSKEQPDCDGDALTSPTITELQTMYLDLNFTQRQRVLEFIVSNICRYSPVDDDNESTTRRFVNQFDPGEVDCK